MCTNILKLSLRNQASKDEVSENTLPIAKGAHEENICKYVNV